MPKRTKNFVNQKRNLNSKNRVTEGKIEIKLGKNEGEWE